MNRKGKKIIKLSIASLILAAIFILVFSNLAAADVINVAQSVRAGDEEDNKMNDVGFFAMERNETKSGVYIEVYDSRDNLKYNGNTDSEGELNFTNLTNDDYTWKAFMNSTPIDSGSFDVTVGEREVQGFVMVLAIEEYECNNIVLGTNNNYRTEVAGVTLKLYDENDTLVVEGTTQYDGFYYSQDLPAGWYDYEIYYDDKLINDGQAYSYGPDQEADSTINGRVTDTNSGENIENAQIGLMDMSEDKVYITWTNDSGYYEVEVVSSNYYVIGMHRKYEQSYTTVSVSSGETGTANLELDKKSELYGYVTDKQSGDPLPGVMVEMDGDNDDQDTESRPDGYYELWVVSGEYNFTATKDGYQTYESSVYLREDEETQRNIQMEKEGGEKTTLEGKVTDSDSGKPIRGAYVELEGTSYSDKTDAEGYYKFSCETGDYTVKASADGYDNYTGAVTIIRGQNFHNFTMNPESGGKTTLEGYITEKGKRSGIENARVRLEGDNIYSDTTDSRGHYFIECQPGNYDVTITHNDYKTHEDNIYVRDGENWYNASLEPNTGFLNGTVMDDSNNDPLKDAKIELKNKDNNDKYSTTTDADGEYSIKLPEGDYEVKVSKTDYHNEYDNVTVEAGGETVVDYRIAPKPGTVHGHVKDSDSGDMLEDAKLTFESKTTDFSDNTLSDTNGSYSISLPEDDYTVTVEKEKYESHSEDINVEKNGDHERTFALDKKMSRLFGNIKEEDLEKRAAGEPVPGADIFIEQEPDDEPVADTTTDNDGNFEFFLEPGEYSVRVEHPDFEIEEEQILLKEDKNSEVNFILTLKNVVLKGKVTDKESGRAAGQPVPGAEVYIEQEPPETPGEDTNTTNTDDNGQYSIFVKPGDFNILVSAEGYDDLHINDVNIPRGEDKTMDFQLDPAKYQRDVEIIGPEPEENMKPGDSKIFQYSLKNTGETFDSFTIEIEGDEVEWASLILGKPPADSRGNANGGPYSQSTSNMEDNGVVDFHVNITVPEAAPDGTFDFSVTATSDNDTEASDQVLITIIVEDVSYGVELVGDKELTTAAGKEITYDLTISNKGTAADTFDISVAAAKHEWVNLEITEIELEPDQDETFSVTVSVPKETPAGTYIFTINATSGGDPNTSYQMQLKATVELPDEGGDDTPGFLLPCVLGSFALASVVFPRKP